MKNTVHCPICMKEIGKLVKEGDMNTPLGRVDMVRIVYDKRKASDIYYSNKYSGLLCKKCARDKSPNKNK